MLKLCFGKFGYHLVLRDKLGSYKLQHLLRFYSLLYNGHIMFFLKSGQALEVIQPLYSFETSLLNRKGFFKCHRSYLVYIPNVDYFSNTEIKTRYGRSIPIARGYGRAFKDTYFSIMFQDK